MEPFGEERLEPRSNQVRPVFGTPLWCQARVLVGLRRFGLNIEALGIDPARASGDEILAAQLALNVVSNFDQSPQGDIRCPESAAWKEVNVDAMIIRIRWFDGGDFESSLRRRL